MAVKRKLGRVRLVPTSVIASPEQTRLALCALSVSFARLILRNSALRHQKCSTSVSTASYRSGPDRDTGVFLVRLKRPQRER